MGSAKQQWMEEQERGWASIDKNVCAECFGDDALKEFIRGHVANSYCDYCGQSSKSNALAASMDDVLELIAESIYSEWEDPNDRVGWDSREGGWMGVDVTDTFDLIKYELDLGIENEELYDDIIDSFGDQGWCQRDPYSLAPDEELTFNWRAFVRLVKHHNRYFFEHVIDNADVYEPQYYPVGILDSLSDIVSQLGLVRSLADGTLLYRGRSHSTQKGYSQVSDLGPPDENNAKYANRMSAAGIPMFYGATDDATVLAELTEHALYVTIGEFRTLRDLNLLDLTQIPPVPSIFDRERRHLRPPLMFLRRFMDDFTQKVEQDGREHIDYVPTQVVTEYFRYVRKLDGILYPSARRCGGHACVLFITQKECIESGEQTNDDKVLVLVTSRVRAR